MAQLIIPNTAQILLQYTQYAEVTENVLYATNTDAITTDDLDELRDAVADWAQGVWMPQMPNTTRLTAVVITDLTTTSGERQTEVFNPSVVGSLGASLPNNVTISIEKVIAERYRGGHGRLYVPGLSSQVISGNELNADFGATLVTKLNDLKTAVSAAGDNTWVLSTVRTDNTDPLAPVKTTRPILNFKLADRHLDSQRRRLTGRGI